jgi:general secretion pathway protein H
MLLDLVLALTVVLLLSAVTWPMLGRGTGSVQQAAIALDIASLLRADRNAASESGNAMGTTFDLQGRTVQGASGWQIQLPPDIGIAVTTGNPCMVGARRFVIVFAPDGTSCGGEVALSSRAQTYTIRINWLSGLVDVAHAQNP